MLSFSCFLKLFKKNRLEQLERIPPFSLLDKLFQINDPAYLMNRNYEVIWGNEHFLRLKQEQDLKKCYEILSGYTQPCPNCSINQVFEQEQSAEWISPSLTLDKVQKVWKIFSTPIKPENEIFALCFANNIIAEKGPRFNFSKQVAPINPNILIKLFETLDYNAVLFDSALNIISVDQNTKKIFALENEKLGTLKALLSKFSAVPTKNIIDSVITNQTISFTSDLNGENYQFHTFGITDEVSGEQNYLMIFKKNSEQHDSERNFLLTLLAKNSEHLSEAIFAIDSVGVLRFANSPAFELLSLKKECINTTILNKLPRIFSEKIYLSTQSGSFIYEIKDIENKPRMFKVHYQKFPNFPHRDVITIYIASELTEILTLQRELENIKSFLTLSTFYTNSVIIRFSTDYKIVDIFGNIDKILPKNSIELRNGQHRWIDFIAPEDKSTVEEIYSEARYFPNYKKSFEYRLLNDNGTIWIEEHLENITNEQGKIIFIQSVIFDITKRKIVEEQLKNSQEEMRNLALYFESLREEEKKKLAFEIHDELGHVLTAMKLELSWILKKKYLRQEVLHDRLRKTIELIEATLRKVRSISSQLRPSVLDHFGIVAAIEWQALEFQKQTSIRCRLFLTKEEIKLDEQKAIAIFRIFQEILTNVARHSNASRVDIHLEFEENNLILTVSDNGKGIKQEEINTKRSLGIIGMKERANAINGKVRIHGISSIGTTVTLSVPLN